MKYTSIISQSTTDISRTNLLELNIPTEQLPMVSTPYSVPLKNRELVDQDITQLEEAEIMSRSMSDLASLICVVPMKDKRPVPKISRLLPAKPKKEFNLRLCINYRKLKESYSNSQTNKIRWQHRKGHCKPFTT